MNYGEREVFEPESCTHEDHICWLGSKHIFWKNDAPDIINFQKYKKEAFKAGSRS